MNCGSVRIRRCQRDQTGAGVDEQPYRCAVDRSVEDDVALFVCRIDECIDRRTDFSGVRNKLRFRRAVQKKIRNELEEAGA